MRLQRFLLALSVAAHLPRWALAAAGTTGASFLELPASVRATALGGAYSALADDAYAPVWNPAGAAWVAHPEVALTHVLYVSDTSNSYLGYVQPLRPHQALAASLQYFRPGTLTGRDASDQLTGDFGGSSEAFSLAYGQAFAEMWSIGVGGQAIRSKIADVSASAWAGNVGVQFRPWREFSLGAVMDHVGSDLKFIDQKDPLPTTERIGAAYLWKKRWLASLEGAFKRGSGSSGHIGVEYQAPEGISLRGGFNSEYRHALTGFAGFSAGIGFRIQNAEVAYAWLPLNDLGQSHLFSLQWRFGQAPETSLHEATSIQEENWNSTTDLLKEFGD